MEQRFERQHIAVTGAGTGIGQAIAIRLAQEGAIVSLMGRTEASLIETQDLIDGGVVCPLDLRDPASVDAGFAEAVRCAGPLSALVANAGTGGPNEPGDGDRWQELVDTNLTGTYRCLRAAQRHLTPEGPRSLVVISSILARIGVPGYTGYCASKAGLLGLTRALAMELAPDNIQVNAICPGWVDTSMAWEGLSGMANGMGISLDEAHEVAMAEVPLGRMSKPHHIAGLVAWLLSEDGTGVTGQALDMNNGAFMS
jgi:NAD(P)-dependent dehydrogenase (short-subunit alcohol dehydrogenase family)